MSVDQPHDTFRQFFEMPKCHPLFYKIHIILFSIKTFVDHIYISIKILILIFLLCKSVLQWHIKILLSSQQLSKMKSREYTFLEAASQEPPDIERLFDHQPHPPTPRHYFNHTAQFFCCLFNITKMLIRNFAAWF